MCKEQMEIIINSFISSSFNYCLLVSFVFLHGKASDKIEQIQKICFRIILNDNVSGYKNLQTKNVKFIKKIKKIENCSK